MRCMELDAAAGPCEPSSWEPVAGGSWVHGHHWLYSKSLFQKSKSKLIT